MKYTTIDQLNSDFLRQREINEDNLKTILRDNADTWYGKKYNFATINSLKEYQSRIPISTYDDYREGGMASAYPTWTVLHSSGTTGSPKEVFLSEEALRRYDAYVFLMPFALTSLPLKNILHVSLFRTNGNNRTLSSAYYQYMKEARLINCDNFLGGEACMFSNEPTDVPYVKLWLALASEDLSAMLSTFLYDILMMMTYLENHWQTILRDMEQRTISVKVPDSIQNVLLHTLPSAKRLQFLHNTFKKGMDQGIMQTLWPNLRFISGVGGRLFQAYDQALRCYTGTIPLYYFSYAQSECLSALATKFEDSSYTLMPRSAFFEFWDMEKNCALLPHEVLPNHIYELIITTFSGAYRYKTGDLVLITGFQGQCPMFEISERASQILNIDGEKLDEKTITNVVSQVINSCSLKLQTYYVGIDRSVMPCRYVLMMELQNEQIDTDKILEIFEENMKSASWDYMDLRAQKLIGDPMFHLLHREEIASIQTGQTKPGIILTDSRVKSILQENR